jgi:hypothetical protein
MEKIETVKVEAVKELNDLELELVAGGKGGDARATNVNRNRTRR